jgi:hypothetical protein
LDEMPKFSQRLDVAINKIYKNGKWKKDLK